MESVLQELESLYPKIIWSVRCPPTIQGFLLRGVRRGVRQETHIDGYMDNHDIFEAGIRLAIHLGDRSIKMVQ